MKTTPPTRKAPSPPRRIGNSVRTQPSLSASLASLQDHSFDASWIKAKNKALKRVFELPPGDTIKLREDGSFLSRNLKKKKFEIDYEKFMRKTGHHRARHNLKIAHDFFPFFYEELKKQIEPTLNPKINLMALVGEQGSSISDAHNTAKRYAKETGLAQSQKKKAEEDAQDARKEADNAIDRTRQEREHQEQQTLRLSEMAKDTHIRNVELTDENSELKMQLAAMERQQLALAEENAKQLEQNRKYAAENQLIRERAQSSRNPAVGLFNIGSESGSDSGSAATTSQETIAVMPETRFKRWTRKAFKRGGRKRTKKKCSKRRLKKKMLCVKGTKRRLKKLKKHTKRLKLKLTRCSKQRLAKNFSVRKKRKYTRRK